MTAIRVSLTVRQNQRMKEIAVAPIRWSPVPMPIGLRNTEAAVCSTWFRSVESAGLFPINAHATARRNFPVTPARLSRINPLAEALND